MWPFKKKTGAKSEAKSTPKQEAVVERLIHRDVKKYTDYLSSPWRIVWTNFLAGVAHGLGIIFGAAIVLTLITFLLSHVFSQIPVVGDFFTAINVWIQETLNQTRK